MKLTGTFCFIGEKEDVLKSSDETMSAYNRNDISCNKHDGALLKSYCHKANIKTGVGVFKEVHDLVKQADDDIETFRMMESVQVAVN